MPLNTLIFLISLALQPPKENNSGVRQPCSLEHGVCYSLLPDVGFFCYCWFFVCVCVGGGVFFFKYLLKLILKLVGFHPNNNCSLIIQSSNCLLIITLRLKK